MGFTGVAFADNFLIADVRMAADFPTERRFWFAPHFHSGQSALMHRQPDDLWRIDWQLRHGDRTDEAMQPENVRAFVQRHLAAIEPHVHARSPIAAVGVR